MGACMYINTVKHVLEILWDLSILFHLVIPAGKHGGNYWIKTITK